MPYARLRHPGAPVHQIFTLLGFAFAYFASYLTALIFGIAAELSVGTLLVILGFAFPLCAGAVILIYRTRARLGLPATAALFGWFVTLAIPIFIVALEVSHPHP